MGGGQIGPWQSPVANFALTQLQSRSAAKNNRCMAESSQALFPVQAENHHGASRDHHYVSVRVQRRHHRPALTPSRRRFRTTSCHTVQLQACLVVRLHVAARPIRQIIFRALLRTAARRAGGCCCCQLPLVEKVQRLHFFAALFGDGLCELGCKLESFCGLLHPSHDRGSWGWAWARLAARKTLTATSRFRG